jgi:cob(I)alamin adenosyltransferase
MSIGLVQIYTGGGKGKTTAAFGIALRAHGQGKRVIVVQFLKGGEPSGEVLAVRKLGLFDVESFGTESFCFDIEENPEHCIQADLAVDRIEKALSSRNYDIVIADELITAVGIGLVQEDRVLAIIESKPNETELIMTGRGATERLIEAADLVTEMREIKHYFAKGIPAREGIEF